MKLKKEALLTCMRPAAAPARVMEATESWCGSSRSTLPYAPKVMALMPATPSRGELMPLYRLRTFTTTPGLKGKHSPGGHLPHPS